MMSDDLKIKEKAVAERLASATHISENKDFAANVREELKCRWDGAVSSLFSVVGASANNLKRESDLWFQRVYCRHTESGRFYHTVVHLKEILDYLQILQESGILAFEQQLHTTIVWATFFHDIVYDPKSNRNEKDSAELFQEFSKSISMPETTAKATEIMILATEKHEIIPMEDSPLLEAVQAFFLDLDMAVLGKQSDAYLSYACMIRKEYSFVPHDVYCTKRAEVLQKFLDESKTIYLTIPFQEALEGRARENLKQEIALLQKGIVPGD
jgi:predicted metal-dependent HD superfamily phosphohydrolase